MGAMGQVLVSVFISINNCIVTQEFLWIYIGWSQLWLTEVRYILSGVSLMITSPLEWGREICNELDFLQQNQEVMAGIKDHKSLAPNYYWRFKRGVAMGMSIQYISWSCEGCDWACSAQTCPPAPKIQWWGYSKLASIRPESSSREWAWSSSLADSRACNTPAQPWAYSTALHGQGLGKSPSASLGVYFTDCKHWHFILFGGESGCGYLGI